MDRQLPHTILLLPYARSRHSVPTLGIFHVAVQTSVPTGKHLVDADTCGLSGAHHHHLGLLDLLPQVAWPRVLRHHWQHRDGGIGVGLSSSASTLSSTLCLYYLRSRIRLSALWLLWFDGHSPDGPFSLER